MGPPWPNLGPRRAPDSLTCAPDPGPRLQRRAVSHLAPDSLTCAPDPGPRLQRRAVSHLAPTQGPVRPDSCTRTRPSPTQTLVRRRPAVRRKPLNPGAAHGPISLPEAFG